MEELLHQMGRGQHDHLVGTGALHDRGQPGERLLVDEFPDLAWAATTQVGALDGIRKRVIKALRRLGDDAPMPNSQREYSGKFLVRTTPRVHRRLSERAAREGRSLNSLVNELLDQ